MNKTSSPILSLRWIALSVAVAVALGVGLFAVAPRSAAPRLDVSTITVQHLLADDGQESHGGGGGKTGKKG
ncbi:MAG TPA: hypothetical protein VKT32_08960 [Chthonomonadaceae bacterium]|nr:hypothetical protein [Chthonomonadaceae bacterium]